AVHGQFSKARESGGGLCPLPRVARKSHRHDERRGGSIAAYYRTTCVRWAEHDPLFPYAWTDRLGETFANLDLAPFPDVGHFPHREDPDRAAGEISAFFDRLSWS